MSVFDEFVRRRDWLICVDSDGCVMDTMESKHMHCFGPCLVTEWALEEWEEPILRRWNDLNLFQLTRGINRFKTLAMILREINEKYTPIMGVDALEHWVKTAKALSNDDLVTAIEGEMEEDSALCLTKALQWSLAVNEYINRLPENLKRPFPGTRETLAEMARFADVAVISGANRDAVEEEWESYGLADYADILMAQDCGSATACIAEMLEFGYEKDHVLMVGDAPGDALAAKENGVYFYPILVNWEEESWEALRKTDLEVFFRGEYGTLQEEKTQTFVENLGG